MRVCSAFLSLILGCFPLTAAGESFEAAEPGNFIQLASEVGLWSAPAGQVSVQQGRGESGQKALRISGGGEYAVVLKLPSAAEARSELVFHAERWTRREPFSLRIDAKAAGGWVELKNADAEAKVGSFEEVRIEIPAGTELLRFRCDSPQDGGILIDDVLILAPAPARVSGIKLVQPVCPAFIREEFNPVLGVQITVEGNLGQLELEEIALGFEGTTNFDEIESFQVHVGGADPASGSGGIVANGQEISKLTIVPTESTPLRRGENWFWISAQLKDSASLDGVIDASVFHVKVNGTAFEPALVSPPGAQRIGAAVRLPGDDGSASYRIPGLVRTQAGSLLAVYDIRYRGPADLPADIDVGVSRSIDSGSTWMPMKVAIDMGNDANVSHDGVGDPAVLVDPANGRIWIAALWSHGNRAWHGSGPGVTPDETGQLVLVHSDDDGVTWSEPRNLTEQVKDPTMRLFLNGPGAGIALDDGTLAFAAQFRAADGKPWSTMISSQDHGETWQVGSGVKSDTTEAQLAQLADGRIMINCRDDRGGSRTIAVTDDLGKSWQFHPTDRAVLREPVCMASLLAWNHQDFGNLLWFSNPDSDHARNQMTIKLSVDQGSSWPEKFHLLYDSRNGFGYSCLAPVNESQIGVLYEGRNSLCFLRIPLREWFGELAGSGESAD